MDDDVTLIQKHFNTVIIRSSETRSGLPDEINKNSGVVL